MIGKLADAIEANIHELAALESLDTGKPIADSLNADLPADHLVLSLLWRVVADKNHGSTLPIDGNYFAYTRARTDRRGRADHPMELSAAEDGVEVGGRPSPAVILWY